LESTFGERKEGIKVKVVIYCGPTLPESEILEILPDEMVLPPAQQGDVDFARRQLGADVIALVDGFHTMVLPPWHKEILSVMDDGARFLGAASLGALRAVECELFGAEPIGEIADMYRSGELESDDEVCLAHADREHHYAALSVPLVNIRATLKACGTGISDSTKREILEYARQLYYPDRNWEAIFEGCELDDIERNHILDSALDLKAADALHLCYTIRHLKEKPVAKRKIKYANEGFGKVFNYNDRMVMTEKGTVRLHEIAERGHGYDFMNARNRGLAIELCDMLGIVPREPVAATDSNSDDLTVEDHIRVCNEERSLERAAEWLSSRAYGNRDAPSVNDYLRISGRYQLLKEK
jgi:hypothetical protein